MKNIVNRYFRQIILLLWTLLIVYLIYIKQDFANTFLVHFYNIISFFIVFGVIFLYHIACEDEYLIRQLNNNNKVPNIEKKWANLWKSYEYTFINGINKTTVPSYIYFNPENMLSASNERIPILSILKSMPGTYTGLGILGTFMGFAAGLSDFNPSTTDSMQESIRTLLTGINTAFNTSIVGVILSISFNFLFLQPLLKRLDDSCKILNDRLDKEYYIDSIDHLREMFSYEEESVIWLPKDYNKEILDNLKKQTKSLSNFTTDLSDSMNNLASALVENYRKQMQDMITSDLKPILEKLALSAEKLVQEKLETTDEALNNIIEKLNITLTSFLYELKNNISEQTKLEMEGLTNNIKIAGESLKQFPSLMEDLKQDVGYLLSKNEESMNKITLDSMSLFSDALSNLKTYSQEAKLMMESFSDLIKVSEKQYSQLINIYNNLEKLSESTFSTSKLLTNATESFKNYSENAISLITRQIEEYKHITQSLESTTMGFSNLDKTLSNSFNEIINNTYQYSETVKDSLKKYLNEYTTSITNFADRLSSATQMLAESIENFQDTINNKSR